MNSVDSILQEIAEVQRASYLIVRTEILEHENTFLKARIYFKEELYMQVYRNDEYGTTNFVLILHDERVYGRDEIRGKWHRHPENEPYVHDTSQNGEKAVKFKEFFEEVKIIIHDLWLI